MTPLSKLNKGQVGRILCIKGDESLVYRLVEIGLHRNDKVQLVDKLLFGKNLVVLSRDGKYVLRKKEADLIKVEILSETSILGGL